MPNPHFYTKYVIQKTYKNNVMCIYNIIHWRQWYVKYKFIFRIAMSWVLFSLILNSEWNP